MALTCVNGAKECDGCGNCQGGNASSFSCSVCGEKIYLGEDVFKFDRFIVCEGCMHDARKVADE